MSMREQLKRLTSESAIYGIGQVSGRAVQLILVPVLTRALTPGAYGISELVFAYLQTAVLVLVLGMDAALARFFYEEPDREARVRMVSSSLVFRLATGSLVAGALALAAGPLAHQLMGSDVYRKYLLIGAATLPFTLVVLFCNDVLRVTFQPGKFIGLNVAWSTVVAGLALYLAVGRHLGVAGVLYGKLFGDVLCAAIGLVLIRHNLRLRFSRSALGRMMRYGLPIVPASLAFGAMTSFDRYVLQRTRSVEEVAVYSVAFKFFAIVTMGVSAFQLAYMPFAYARAKAADALHLYARVLALYVACASFGALLIGVFAPEALALLAPGSYAGAAGPAAWLAFAAVAQGAYTVAGIGIAIALRTPLLGWIAGGASFVAILANVLLTPRLGPVGAAMATWLAHVTSVVLAYAIAQRVHPAPYRGMRLAFVFGIALALTIAAQRLAPQGLPGVAVKLSAALVFAAIVWRLELWKERGSVSSRSSALAPSSSPDQGG
jgi:O-antigen/teichoic acid export membrane protein